MEENLFPTLSWEVTGLQTMVLLEHSIEGVVSREPSIVHKSSEGATDFLKELTSPPYPSHDQRSGHHRVTAIDDFLMLSAVAGGNRLFLTVPNSSARAVFELLLEAEEDPNIT